MVGTDSSRPLDLSIVGKDAMNRSLPNKNMLEVRLFALDRRVGPGNPCGTHSPQNPTTIFQRQKQMCFCSIV